MKANFTLIYIKEINAIAFSELLAVMRVMRKYACKGEKHGNVQEESIKRFYERGENLFILETRIKRLIS